MKKQWESKGIYQHPINPGLWGKVALSQAGVYVMCMGHTVVSCPPDWAARIHAQETQASDTHTPIEAKD